MPKLILIAWKTFQKVPYKVIYYLWQHKWFCSLCWCLKTHLFYESICKHYVSNFALQWCLISQSLWLTQSPGSILNVSASSILQQFWFLHPVKCNLCANLAKSVLTFTAEKLITEFSNELHIYGDEVQSCGQWLFSHSVNSSDSAVNMWVCSTKAALTWLFFLQGHKNEMDTILSFMLFHILMRFSFSWTVKVLYAL